MRKNIVNVTSFPKELSSEPHTLPKYSTNEYSKTAKFQKYYSPR